MNSAPLSESRPSSGNGNRERISEIAWLTAVWVLLEMATHSVHPVAISVAVRVKCYAPAMLS